MRAQFYTLVFVFCACIGHAQSHEGKTYDVRQLYGDLNTRDFHNVGFFYASAVLDAGLNSKFVSPKTEGSPLLFDDWNNQGVIVMGDKKYHFNNLNYNISRDEFMSKINNDSVFVFDLSNIDKIIVGNKQFKQLYDSGERKNKIYEVIYENDNFSLLKDYFIITTEGSPNPMLNRPNDKIVKKSTYFIMRNNSIEPFGWSKRSIVNLIDKEKKEEFKKYVKKNNLSYRDESDVRTMLKYFL